MVERLRELCGTSLRAAGIAELLNAEGFRPPRRAQQFTAHIVLDLLARLGLPRSRLAWVPMNTGRQPWPGAWACRGIGFGGGFARGT